MNHIDILSILVYSIAFIIWIITIRSIYRFFKYDYNKQPNILSREDSNELESLREKEIYNKQMGIRRFR
tara:strand:+ start:660 stop:866 length:207 start_codon:yes stop_codon:yes gene_type:complete